MVLLRWGRSVIQTTAARIRKKTLPERLRSEPLRHGLALGCAMVLGILLGQILQYSDIAISGSAQDPIINESVAAALSLFAFYGPLYFILSRYAWRNLAGDALREELQATRVPNKGWVRTYLVGTPAQMATSAALFSLAAVSIVAIRPGAPVALLVISLACVCGSWILVMSSFTVDYAREWAESDGFVIPGGDEVTYSDFTYLAVQASTTYSSSDITTATRGARRLVTIHALTAFIFATVIVAVLVAVVLNTLAA